MPKTIIRILDKLNVGAYAFYPAPLYAMTKLTKIALGLLGLLIISCSPSKSTDTKTQITRRIELDTIAEYNALNPKIEEFDGFETIDDSINQSDSTAFIRVDDSSKNPFGDE